MARSAVGSRQSADGARAAMSRRRSPAAAVGAAALPPLHTLSINPVVTVKTADIGTIDEQQVLEALDRFVQNPSFDAFEDAITGEDDEYALALAIAIVQRDGRLLQHLLFHFEGGFEWALIAHHAVKQNGNAVVAVPRVTVWGSRAPAWQVGDDDGIPKLLLEAMQSDNPAQPVSLYDHMMFYTQELREEAPAQDTVRWWQERNLQMPEHWMAHFVWFQTLNTAYYEEPEEWDLHANEDVRFVIDYYELGNRFGPPPYQSELHRGEPLFRLDYVDHPEHARDVGVIDSVVHGLFNKTSTGAGYELAAAGGFAEHGLANNPIFCSYMLTSILEDFELTVPLQYIYRWVWTFSDSPEIGTSWKPALGSVERVRLVHQLLREDARAWFKSELQRQFVAGDARLLEHVVRALPGTWGLLPAASPLRNDVELMLDAALAPEGSRDAAVALVKQIDASVREKPLAWLRRSVENAFKYILGLGDDETLDELDALYPQETAHEAVNDLMAELAKRHPPLPPPNDAAEDYEDELARVIRELLAHVNRPDGALGRMDKRDREAALDDADRASRRQSRRLGALVAYYNGRHAAARHAVLRSRSRPARMGRV